MATLETAERWVGWLAGLALLATLGVIFLGLWRELRRTAGLTDGRLPGLLKKPAFYLLAGAGYFGLCALLWRPLPLALSPPARALGLGARLYCPGLALVVWGRLALGKLYFVSTTPGAQLFADHRLITSGPYARLRHPMYLGLLLAGLDGVPIFQTWTFVFIALHFPGLSLRARREEQVLSAEFGPARLDYCRQTPRGILRGPRRGRPGDGR